MATLKVHPHFNYPDPNTSLWRYMDFTKFIALLEDESLFMTRLDKFKDTFEGAITQYDKANRDTLYDPGLVSIMNHVDKLAHLQSMLVGIYNPRPPISGFVIHGA